MSTDTSQVKLASEVIEVEDSLEAANDWFLDRQLSDGLPIVPPHPRAGGTDAYGHSPGSTGDPRPGAAQVGAGHGGEDFSPSTA